MSIKTQAFESKLNMTQHHDEKLKTKSFLPCYFQYFCHNKFL